MTRIRMKSVMKNESSSHVLFYLSIQLFFVLLFLLLLPSSFFPFSLFIFFPRHLFPAHPQLVSRETANNKANNVCLSHFLRKLY